MDPKKKNQKIAVGLLQCSNKYTYLEDDDVQGATGKAQNEQQDRHVYEAIILCHALEGLTTEYPHLIGPLTRYSTKGKGVRPPKAPVE